jgi:hypothetical protein
VSQAYYFGSVGTNPDHRVEVIDEPIDVLDELELIAIGKPATKAGGGSSTASCAPVDEAALLTATEIAPTAAIALAGAPLDAAGSRLADDLAELRRKNSG